MDIGFILFWCKIVEGRSKEVKVVKGPKISIVTASYNYEDLIVTAIESIINQTYKNWELIIVDDGSSDNSVEVIKKYTEKYDNIFLFQHENGVNKGLKETVKLGIEKCSSNYIAFLESDDYWREDCLEKRVEIINEYPNVGFIFNDVELFGDEESVNSFKGYFENQKKLFGKMSWPNNNLLFYLFLVNLIPTFSCITVKKEVFEKCNFETPYDPWLDWWVYVQIVCITSILYVDEKLTYWKRHKESYIACSNQKLRLRKQALSFRRSLIKEQKKYIANPLDYFILTLLKHEKTEKFFRGFIRVLLDIRNNSLTLSS